MRVSERRFFTNLISTKRAEGSGGRRTERVTYLEYVESSPVEPLDSEFRARYFLEGGSQMYQLFIYDYDLDVRENDSVVSGGIEYIVRGKEVWEGIVNPGVGAFMMLVLEKIQ